MSEVTRAEFVGLEKTVDHLAHTVDAGLKGLNDNVNRLTTVVHEMLPTIKQQMATQRRNDEEVTRIARQQAAASGIKPRTLFSVLALVIAASSLITAGVGMYVYSQLRPIEIDMVHFSREMRDGVKNISEQMQSHNRLGSHGRSDARISLNDQMVRAVHMDNQTQSLWTADIVNLQMDWMQRWMRAKVVDGRIEIPSPSYQPFVRLGQVNRVPGPGDVVGSPGGTGVP